MKVTVIPTAKDINQEAIIGKTTLIIDVLRATSTIVTALNNGAKEIIPVFTIEDAIGYKANYKDYKIGGERRGIQPADFDFGNSPLEYSEEEVKNNTIVITTTNGTRAIKQSESADIIFILSLLNLDALIQTVYNEEEIILVCSGTDDLFSLDDGICAGAFIYHMRKKTTISELNDIGLGCERLYETTNHNLHELLNKCGHYKYLLSIGCSEDLNYCLQENIIDIVPIYKNGRIVKSTP